MSTANLAGGLKGPGRKADYLTAICEPTLCLEDEGTSTSHNPMGLHGRLAQYFLCEICDPHDGDHDDCSLLGCEAVLPGISSPAFRRKVLPPKFGPKSKPSVQHTNMP
jgi:hypothetical protein